MAQDKKGRGQKWPPAGAAAPDPGRPCASRTACSRAYVLGTGLGVGRPKASPGPCS